MIVELEPWEYEHASHVGIGRVTANWGVQDAAHYEKSRMQDDRTASVAGAICELAVAKHTNQFWSGSVWPRSAHDTYKHLPDVGMNIEVRRVRTGKKVAVRERDTGRGLELWAARAVEPEFRSVDVLGYLPYDTAWEWADSSSFDGTRYLPIVHLVCP